MFFSHMDASLSLFPLSLSEIKKYVLKKKSSLLCQSSQMGQNGLLEKYVIVILIRMMGVKALSKFPCVSPM